ncbi:dipeptide epimerase, partial [bacterium]|nr:dipeptide epimerase [bacterium]
ENIFVEIEQEGIVGWGEAAPSKFYHEDTKTVPAALQKLMPLLKTTPFFYEEIQAAAAETVTGNFAAKAALDMAILDWVGKKLNIPVWKLFGLNPQKKQTITSFTIGLDSLDILPQKITEADEYPILKVKLGTSEDYEIISKIRELTPKPLYIDANEGWKFDEALEKVEWLADKNVILIEQPLLAGQHKETLRVREKARVPIIADESVKTWQDILPLTNTFDGINIKLMKCGGLVNALKMVHIARAAGLKVMLGCFIESSLGITAAAQIASLCDYVDLDGSLLVAKDPFQGAVFENGVLSLPDRPGLGVLKNKN